MLDHCAVTTFSPKGFELYGRTFLESFLLHWDIPIVVCHEGHEPDIRDDRVKYLDLDRDLERNLWLVEHKDKQGHPANPNMQAIKFSHKVFAVTGFRPPTRWWIWMDADVVWQRDVGEDALLEMLPEDCCLSFLGRTATWQWPDGTKAGPYTEASFIGYRTEDVRVASMVDNMRHVYLSGELFTLGQNTWHDSYVFDHCRRRSGIPEQEQHNLSKGSKAVHVWPKTVLGLYGRHNKGPSRKQIAYGRPEA